MWGNTPAFGFAWHLGTVYFISLDTGSELMVLVAQGDDIIADF